MRPKIPNERELSLGFIECKRQSVGAKVNSHANYTPRVVKDVWLSDENEIVFAFADGNEEKAKDCFAFPEKE